MVNFLTVHIKCLDEYFIYDLVHDVKTVLCYFMLLASS